MARIDRDDLVPGMTVAQNVLNRRGQVLVPAGVELTERHLQGLKTWGIATIQIQNSSTLSISADDGIDVLDPETEERYNNYLRQRFVLNQEHAEHPLLEQLVALGLQRLTDLGLPEDDGQLQQSSDVVVEPGPPMLGKRPLTADRLMEMPGASTSLPSVYFELKKVVSSSVGSASKIAGVIKNDPGLTARLLRIVNSAYYSFSREIGTVSRAVTVIGTDELSDLVLATSVISTFGDDLDGFMDMNSFWRHSVTCGCYARALASLRKESSVERFFVMGLLHDVGRLVLLVQLTKQYTSVVEFARRKGVSLGAAERAVFGFSHAEIGGRLVTLWNLPPSHQEAVTRHHNPESAQRYPVETAIVHIADLLANVSSIAESEQFVFPTFVPEAWEKLGLAPEDLAGMVQGVENRVDEIFEMFLG